MTGSSGKRSHPMISSPSKIVLNVPSLRKFTVTPLLVAGSARFDSLAQVDNPYVPSGGHISDDVINIPNFDRWILYAKIPGSKYNAPPFSEMPKYHQIEFPVLQYVTVPGLR